MPPVDKTRSLVVLFGLVAAACGGGTDPVVPPAPAPSPTPAPSPSPGAPPPIGAPSPSPPAPAPAPAPSDAQRIAAATSTAENNSLCNAIRPFYWEIGDRNARAASASLGAPAVGAGTAMNIASASKWIYGAYVLELRTGTPSADDIRFLTLRSGYDNLGALSCAGSATVDACLNLGANGAYTPANDGKFSYNGGHMQRHAHDIGLGGLDGAALAFEVQAKIGDFGFQYASPQPAGGVFTTADAYAAFLRKILAGGLQIASKLGSNAVCTNPATCADAVSTPVPASQSWHYSLGHWVEDDPVVGDGAFSSAGLFGFYPWIDASKTYYGVIARVDAQGEAGFESAQCGQVIRKAWATGVAQ
jgi:hypothetical protein